MPLIDTALSTAIQVQLTAQYGSPVDAASQKKFADAIATAVITYFKSNTLVSGTIAGAADPVTHIVTGTCTGTIS